MAPTRACASGSFSAMPMSMAIRRVRVVCCACAEKGDAALPIRAMNTRRFYELQRHRAEPIVARRLRQRYSMRTFWPSV